MTSKYATVDIGQNGQWRMVWVSRKEWASIAYTDYIELDEQGNLLSSYRFNYTPAVQQAMLAVAAKRLLPVVTEPVIDTQEVKP